MKRKFMNWNKDYKIQLFKQRNMNNKKYPDKIMAKLLNSLNNKLRKRNMKIP